MYYSMFRHIPALSVIFYGLFLVDSVAKILGMGILQERDPGLKSRRWAIFKGYAESLK